MYTFLLKTRLLVGQPQGLPGRRANVPFGKSGRTAGQSANLILPLNIDAAGREPGKAQPKKECRQ